MKRLLSLVVAILVSASASAAAISGSVVEDGTSTALPGMTVEVWTPEGVLVAGSTTDTTGNFTLNVPAASYRILAYDNSGSYATSFYDRAESFETSTVLSLTNKGISGLRIALEKAAFIEGTVAASDKAPIAFAKVTAYNGSGTRRTFTSTDATGHYRLVVPAGSYKVAAWDDAGTYLASFFQGRASFADATPITVAAENTAIANFQLAKASTMAGTVTAGGSPFAATVSIYRATGELAWTGVAGSDGKFAARVPAGSYRVVIFDPAGVWAPFFFRSAESFDRSDILVLGEGEVRSDVDASLVAAGHFTGTVRNASTGAPLPAMTVAAFNADGTLRAFATTDTSGRYTLVVPPGAYRIAAWDDGLVYLRRFIPSESTFAWAPEWSVSAAQTLSFDFALPLGAVVSGVVRDAASGAALSGITVAAYDETGVVTSASGAYRLLLESGSFEIAAHDLTFTYASETRAVAAVAGKTSEGEDFALAVGAHLSGFVRSLSGAPVPGAIVSIYDGTGAVIASATARADGSYDVASPAGKFSFAAYDPTHRFHSSAPTNGLTVNAGQKIGGFNFVLAPSARRRAVVR